MSRNKTVNGKRKNLITSVICQVVTTLCGVIIPRVMIVSFGSAVYGITTSIAQFLSYISLLEGGIGRVARGALYKPLAACDMEKTSLIYYEMKKTYDIIGILFILYTLVLSLFFYDIANIEGVYMSPKYVMLLVWIISLSTLVKYLGGMPNLTLLNADQKQYISNITVIFTTILNTIVIIALVQLECDLLGIKLISSIVFIVRPLVYLWSVKKNYTIVKNKELNRETMLPQKWTGLGQHFAYFLHNNTDIVILTLFCDIKWVAVYSVYNLVILSIKNITISFTGGMEAVFGELIATQNIKDLRKAYYEYKLIVSCVGIVLFSVATVLIVPFVKLYTAGVTDANYEQPLFAIIYLIAEAFSCFSLPCSTLPISANKLGESKLGSYGEAIINIITSCVLVIWRPLLGVALGTLLSSLFKNIYYMQYTAKNILHISLNYVLKLQGLIFVTYALIVVIGWKMILIVKISDYFSWFICAVVLTLISLGITTVILKLFYPNEMNSVFKNFLNMKN